MLTKAVSPLKELNYFTDRDFTIWTKTIAELQK